MRIKLRICLRSFELDLMPSCLRRGGFTFLRHKSVKSFNVKGYSLFELKIRHKNNAFRFFFVMQKPNVVVLYGFTKKTQKTDKKDVKLGMDNLKDYLEKQKTISLMD